QKVIVPSVVGFAQADGLATLEQSGFYVQVRTETSTQPVGTIIYQTPSGGVPDFQTNTVTITVAKALPAG
ncbi:MAG TPA: PASTA domain-containing protein, partial [Actinomycetota bacterium]|nr:PASTA domain-containing protein [Actinomycetota bacterium]